MMSAHTINASLMGTIAYYLDSPTALVLKLNGGLDNMCAAVGLRKHPAEQTHNTFLWLPW